MLRFGTWSYRYHKIAGLIFSHNVKDIVEMIERTG
jgi:hypothetical protein